MSEATPEALKAAIYAALKEVIDPELGHNVVDLGLIYDVTVEDGGIARITMSTTTRGCPATGFLKDAAHNCAWDVPGIEFVEVTLTYDPHWTPQMMSDEAKAVFGVTAQERW